MQQPQSFVQQQAAFINSLNSPFPAQTTTQGTQGIAPATQGEPKRKRVQVPSACNQCKRAHAACSNTRPCDRCVRINQAEACVNSHLASLRAQSPATATVKPQEKVGLAQSTGVQHAQPAVNAPPPALTPNSSVPFNENDVSRFLFEENHDEFPEFPERFGECIEACTSPHSPCNLNSSNPCLSSATPSPSSSQSFSSPSVSQQSTPSPSSSTSSFSSPCTTPCATPCTPLQTSPAQTQQITTSGLSPQQVTTSGLSPRQQGFTPNPAQQFAITDAPIPAATVGPSPAAVAASITAQYPHGGAPLNTNLTHSMDTGAMDATPTYSVTHNAHAQTQFNMPPALAPHTVHTVSGPPTNMMEVMVTELVQQNKKMENMLLSINAEMKSLKEEMSNLKQAGHSMLAVSKTDMLGPATAVWTVNEGMLIEHNQKFAQLLDFAEVPKGYTMQHFFGGPCSKAASQRMQHHLENIKNSQPVTDYAVIERKRVTGDVMRLMIVVNVVPTPTPVFITTMYEL